MAGSGAAADAADAAAEVPAPEEVLRLPCSHAFHTECLAPWLEAHNTCPTCRAVVTVADEGSCAAAAAAEAAAPTP